MDHATGSLYMQATQPLCNLYSAVNCPIQLLDAQLEQVLQETCTRQYIHLIVMIQFCSHFDSHNSTSVSAIICASAARHMYCFVTICCDDRCSYDILYTAYFSWACQSSNENSDIFGYSAAGDKALTVAKKILDPVWDHLKLLYIARLTALSFLFLFFSH